MIFRDREVAGFMQRLFTNFRVRGPFLFHGPLWSADMCQAPIGRAQLNQAQRVAANYLGFGERNSLQTINVRPQC